MQAPDLGELIADVQGEVAAGLLRLAGMRMRFAEAIECHQEAADKLFHAFGLLVPSVVSDGWGTGSSIGATRGSCCSGSPGRGRAARYGG